MPCRHRRKEACGPARESPPVLCDNDPMDSTTIPGAGNIEDPDVRTVLRQTDWSTSPLGLPETWPRELVAVAHLVFDSEFPMFVAWGAELGFLYNDAYAAVMGRKHPAGFGQRFRDVWPEIWEDIRSIVQDALDGKSAWFEDLPLIVERKGYREEAWFTFSYSPVKDANGSVAGIYCACVETTNRVLVEKRQVFQLGLSDQLRDLGSSDEVIARSSDMLGRLLQASRVL